MDKYRVYVHIFPNGKRYIGITKEELNERWKNGLGYEKQPVYKAIKKYGWDNIKHEVLFENLSREEAFEKEKELIAFYKSNNSQFGYNHTTGGDGCYIVTEQARKNMSNAQKGRKLSEETKEKIRQKHLGVKQKPEVIEKRARSLRGKKRVCTEDRLRRIKEGIKNMPKEKKELWVERNRKARIGKKIPNRKGKIIIQKDIKTGEVISKYISLCDAQRKTGIDRGTISDICNRKTKNNTNVACGYIWEFENEKPENDNREKAIVDIVNIQNVDFSPLKNKLNEIGL